MADNSAAALDHLGYLAEFVFDNAACPPDWRHKRVEYLLRPELRRPLHSTDDTAVRAQYYYVQAYRRAADQLDRERLARAHPDAWRAHSLWRHKVDDGNSAAALTVEIRLLAGQTYTEIAKVARTTSLAIALYDSLYFDVTGFLECRDWIQNCVLLPAMGRKYRGRGHPEYDEAASTNSPIVLVEPFLDGSIKYLAYYGGAAVVDLLLSGFPAKLTRPTVDTFDEWMDTAFYRSLKAKSTQAALKMNVNRYNLIEVWHQYAELRKIERAYESGSQQAAGDVVAAVRAIIADRPPTIIGSGRGGDTGEGKPMHRASELRLVDKYAAARGEVIEYEYLDALPPPRQAAIASGETISLTAGM